MSWNLGDTSKRYEVGNGGPGTVSSGRGDRGGVSYGTYQLSSKVGTCARFVEEMGYSSYFGGNPPGSPEFSRLWKVKAATDPTEFGNDQHEFIKRTHFDPQMSYLDVNGIDFSSRGPAVQDAVWSTSVQFGGKTSLIKNALSKHLYPNELTDKQVVKSIQNYKIENNERLFRRSSAAVRKGTLRRAYAEKNDLIDLADQYSSTPVQPEPEPEPTPVQPPKPETPPNVITPPLPPKKKRWWEKIGDWFS